MKVKGVLGIGLVVGAIVCTCKAYAATKSSSDIEKDFMEGNVEPPVNSTRLTDAVESGECMEQYIASLDTNVERDAFKVYWKYVQGYCTNLESAIAKDLAKENSGVPKDIECEFNPMGELPVSAGNIYFDFKSINRADIYKTHGNYLLGIKGSSVRLVIDNIVYYPTTCTVDEINSLCKKYNNLNLRAKEAVKVGEATVNVGQFSRAEFRKKMRAGFSNK